MTEDSKGGGVAHERLYGLPGDEYLHDDPAAVYEDIEPEAHGDPVEIEEWTVYPRRYHLPAALTLLEWVEEWTADSGELAERFDPSFRSPAAVAAAEAFLDVLADESPWRMADRKVASHWVTWDEAGEPLLDGEPMYRLAAGGTK